MPHELPDELNPKVALEQHVDSLRTEAESLKEKEGDFDDYAERLMAFMDEWGLLWADIESAQESIRKEVEESEGASASDHSHAYIFELGKIERELQDLRYETSHLITYPEARKLLYEKFISQTFDGVEVETESGEVRTSESKAIYEAAMELLRSSSIPPYFLSMILYAAEREGAASIDTDGVERMWEPLIAGNDVDLGARIRVDRTWIKGHPDVAVRYLDINLLSFEKGFLGSSNDRPYEMLDVFLSRVYTYDLTDAVPETQREYYRNQIEKWRKERIKLEE